MDTREWYMVLTGQNLSKLGRLRKRCGNNFNIDLRKLLYEERDRWNWLKIT
jgi:hypothetical protein